MLKKSFAVLWIALLVIQPACVFSQTEERSQIECWITNPDRSALFTKQMENVAFRSSNRGWGTTIVIDDRQEFQSIDGFGFALTGGSAEHMVKMIPEARTKLLTDLFATDNQNIGVSYIRLTIGSSDLNSFVFSYDDLPEGETDFELKNFDLAQDKKDVIPVMKEILSINPSIKILGSPWSAPAWMKTNNNVRGGFLKEACYDSYAMYFVKYIQAMKKAGITIDAITIQNEPLNSKNTPSMTWYVEQQEKFLRDHLKPAFQKAGISTKVVLFDHNCDRPDYPLTLLSDPGISDFADGTGFHHYGGDMGAMSIVHMARPDKNLYFTEQMVTERPGRSNIDIANQVKRMIVDVTRNWSRNVILWNFAADSLNDPHTDNGGCSMCQGAVTISGNDFKHNIAYYTIAHASKFVRPGSIRIASANTGDETVSLTEDEERPGIKRIAVIENTGILPNVAFKTPEGKIVLVVSNNTWSTGGFKIQYRGRYARIRLNPGAVGTYVWAQ